MVIVHKLSDLDTLGESGSAMRALASSLLANAETRVVYRQESDQLSSISAALGLAGTEKSLIPTLGTRPTAVAGQAPLVGGSSPDAPAE